MSSPAQDEPSAFRFAPAARLWIGGNDEDVRRAVYELLGPVDLPPAGALDALVITPTSIDEWAYFLDKHRSRLEGAGVAWVVFSDQGRPEPGSLRQAAERAGMVRWATVSPAPGLWAEGYRPAARPRLCFMPGRTRNCRM